MAQLRIRMERVGAGSAARQAEREATETSPARTMRVEAGSAARVAEEAKRAGANQPAQGMAAFSLRAQSGRVQRYPAASAPDVPTATPSSSLPPARLPASSVAGATAKTDFTHGSAPGSSSFRADSSPVATGRLKSFLRGLFLPEDPSQP